ncbi:unnamed protein product [Menidia menidia]|uniref:(Atlantic silverside) hypothetical protein n=1 Tax=Menidia menidia TaxID=238744 RepID=A0A8S4BB83_9TELE|nr:unnamed protein product [Menidia menidia]
MRSLVLITALSLCRLSWSSASQTLEVRLGEDVTLMCSNISKSVTQTDWFRVVNGTEPSCVSSMYYAHEATVCYGFKSGKFNMSSNVSTTFLQIKGVDFSDSGLYFCGFYKKRHTILVCAVELTRKGHNESNKKAHPDSGVPPKDGESYTVTYGCLIVFFLMAVVGVVLKAKCPSKGWVSVSVSEFHTVEVQPGEEVTLLCSNFSILPTFIFWFKMANGPNATCISYMMISDSNASLCDGYKNDQFKMTSNTTNLFLNIKQVDLSDSGLYFCGVYIDGHCHFQCNVFRGSRCV